MNNADHKTNGKNPEWYPSTKFFADILKEEGRTNPVYHKAQIANIVKKINKTKLIDKVNKTSTRLWS
jgi:hypothetical protein